MNKIFSVYIKRNWVSGVIGGGFLSWSLYVFDVYMVVGSLMFCLNVFYDSVLSDKAKHLAALRDVLDEQDKTIAPYRAELLKIALDQAIGAEDYEKAARIKEVMDAPDNVNAEF